MPNVGEPWAPLEARHWLGAIVHYAEDAIVSMDLEGTVTSWNPGAERLFGRRAAEMISQPVWCIAAAGRLAELQATMSRAAKGRRIPTRDTRLAHRDGREIDVAMSVSLVRGVNGEPVGLAAMLRDITERKLAEKDLHRLLSETQRHERSHQAVSEIRLALLGGGDIGQSLALIAARAAELVGAEGVVVVVPTDDGAGLVAAAAEGRLVTHLRGREIDPEGTVAKRVFSSGRPQTMVGAPPGLPLQQEVGPVLGVPLTTSTGTSGVLTVVRAPEAPAFDAEETRLLGGFAEQAALAIELARGRADGVALAVVAERERIARDLHDHVIQRLFAVGMSLQTALRNIEPGQEYDRVGRAVDELDATIRQVRSAIFALEVQARRHETSSVREKVLEVASQAAEALGFEPRVQFEGPVDALVAATLLPDLLATVRESLSNTAKHAGASNVEVWVCADKELVVRVTDDGAGMARSTRSSGLANLKARAEQRGGSFGVGDGERGGTCVQWRVPLPS